MKKVFLAILFLAQMLGAQQLYKPSFDYLHLANGTAIKNRAFTSATNDICEVIPMDGIGGLVLRIFSRDSATILVNVQTSYDGVTWMDNVTVDSLQQKADGNTSKKVDLTQYVNGTNFSRVTLTFSANAFPVGTTSAFYSATLEKSSVPTSVGLTGSVLPSQIPLTAHLFEVARSGKPYTDPAVAYAAMSTGDAMSIAPGVYSSNFNITKENITIYGAGADSVILSGTDTIFASRGQLNDLTFTNALTFEGQSVSTIASYLNSWNIQSCQFFSCNLSFGTPVVQMLSVATLYDCVFNDSTKLIYGNVSNPIRFYNCSNTRNGLGQKLTLYNATPFYFFDCEFATYQVYLSNLPNRKTPSPQISVWGGSFGVDTWQFSHSCVFNQAGGRFAFTESGTPLVIPDSVEFDLSGVSISEGGGASTITYGSSYPSRWYGAYGTSVLSNLIIARSNALCVDNCVFGFKQPAGLKEWWGTTWGAFQDF